MTETSPDPPSPNDVLASQIADALVTAGLINDAHKTELLSKLKAGGVKEEDWNLWVDMATAPPHEPVEADDE